MSQLGSMDEEKAKKPLLLPTMSKKPPPSFLSDAQEFSLLAALLFACFYDGLAAYNLRDRQCQTGWLMRMRCSAPQAAAAALALALLASGRSRRGLGIRAAAFIALAATTASHWMYASILGRIDDGPGDLFLAVETASVVAAAALDLLGFIAFVLGGDE